MPLQKNVKSCELYPGESSFSGKIRMIQIVALNGKNAIVTGAIILESDVGAKLQQLLVREFLLEASVRII